MQEDACAEPEHARREVWAARPPCAIPGPGLAAGLESAQQGQTISISGTVRNVAWEGLDSKVRGTFKDAGVVLPERVLLFEAESAASTSDHFRALFGLIVGALLGALAGRNFKPEGESSSTLAMADAAE